MWVPKIGIHFLFLPSYWLNRSKYLKPCKYGKTASLRELEPLLPFILNFLKEILDTKSGPKSSWQAVVAFESIFIENSWHDFTTLYILKKLTNLKAPIFVLAINYHYMPEFHFIGTFLERLNKPHKRLIRLHEQNLHRLIYSFRHPILKGYNRGYLQFWDPMFEYWACCCSKCCCTICWWGLTKNCWFCCCWAAKRSSTRMVAVAFLSVKK